MANPYEQAARAKKVEKLVDALDVNVGHRATVADLADLANEGPRLNKIMAAAGIRNLSSETVSMLVSRITARDSVAGEFEFDPFAKVAPRV